MRFAGMALALALVLSGCGGEAAKESSPTRKATSKSSIKPAKVTTGPSATAATGVPAPGDLVDFQCSPDGEGIWKASGILRNGSKKPVTYQVTVYVGEADGKEAKAITKQVQSVQAGGSIKVELKKIPAGEDATQCYVRVLAK